MSQILALMLKVFFLGRIDEAAAAKGQKNTATFRNERDILSFVLTFIFHVFVLGPIYGR